MTKYGLTRNKISPRIYLLTSLLFTFSQGNMPHLVEELVRQSKITSYLVKRTMLEVDRKNFCPKAPFPYSDEPEIIGFGATISAPSLHAMVLELLKHHLVAGGNALDIGSGSGYVTVCMATMLGKGGITVGIEHIPELVLEAANNTRKHHKRLVNSGRIKYVIGDGRSGFKKFAPYNAIHCGANFDEILIKILAQLKLGGRFVGPIGTDEEQYLTVIDKMQDGNITVQKILAVRYLSMQSKEKQLSRWDKVVVLLNT